MSAPIKAFLHDRVLSDLDALLGQIRTDPLSVVSVAEVASAGVAGPSTFSSRAATNASASPSVSAPAPSFKGRRVQVARFSSMPTKQDPSAPTIIVVSDKDFHVDALVSPDCVAAVEKASKSRFTQLLGATVIVSKCRFVFYLPGEASSEGAGSSAASGASAHVRLEVEEMNWMGGNSNGISDDSKALGSETAVKARLVEMSSELKRARNMASWAKTATATSAEQEQSSSKRLIPITSIPPKRPPVGLTSPARAGPSTAKSPARRKSPSAPPRPTMPVPSASLEDPIVDSGTSQEVAGAGAQQQDTVRRSPRSHTKASAAAASSSKSPARTSKSPSTRTKSPGRTVPLEIRHPGWGEYEHEPTRIPQPSPEDQALLDDLPEWGTNWKYQQDLINAPPPPQPTATSHNHPFQTPNSTHPNPTATDKTAALLQTAQSTTNMGTLATAIPADPMPSSDYGDLDMDGDGIEQILKTLEANGGFVAPDPSQEMVQPELMEEIMGEEDKIPGTILPPASNHSRSHDGGASGVGMEMQLTLGDVAAENVEWRFTVIREPEPQPELVASKDGHQVIPSSVVSRVSNERLQSPGSIPIHDSRVAPKRNVEDDEMSEDLEERIEYPDSMEARPVDSLKVIERLVEEIADDFQDGSQVRSSVARGSQVKGSSAGGKAGKEEEDIEPWSSDKEEQLEQEEEELVPDSIVASQLGHRQPPNQQHSAPSYVGTNTVQREQELVADSLVLPPQSVEPSNAASSIQPGQRPPPSQLSQEVDPWTSDPAEPDARHDAQQDSLLARMFSQSQAANSQHSLFAVPERPVVPGLLTTGLSQETGTGLTQPTNSMSLAAGMLMPVLDESQRVLFEEDEEDQGPRLGGSPVVERMVVELDESEGEEDVEMQEAGVEDKEGEGVVEPELELEVEPQVEHLPEPEPEPEPEAEPEPGPEGEPEPSHEDPKPTESHPEQLEEPLVSSMNPEQSATEDLDPLAKPSTPVRYFPGLTQEEQLSPLTNSSSPRVFKAGGTLPMNTQVEEEERREEMSRVEEEESDLEEIIEPDEGADSKPAEERVESQPELEEAHVPSQSLSDSQGGIIRLELEASGVTASAAVSASLGPSATAPVFAVPALPLEHGMEEILGSLPIRTMDEENDTVPRSVRHDTARSTSQIRSLFETAPIFAARRSQQMEEEEVPSSDIEELAEMEEQQNRSKHESPPTRTETSKSVAGETVDQLFSTAPEAPEEPKSQPPYPRIPRKRLRPDPDEEVVVVIEIDDTKRTWEGTKKKKVVHPTTNAGSQHIEIEMEDVKEVPSPQFSSPRSLRSTSARGSQTPTPLARQTRRSASQSLEGSVAGSVGRRSPRTTAASAAQSQSQRQNSQGRSPLKETQSTSGSQRSSNKKRILPPHAIESLPAEHSPRTRSKR